MENIQTKMDEAVGQGLEKARMDIEACDNPPLPWCVGCEMATQFCDEDGCCASCGVDIWTDANGGIRPINAELHRFLGELIPEGAEGGR